MLRSIKKCNFIEFIHCRNILYVLQTQSNLMRLSLPNKDEKKFIYIYRKEKEIVRYFIRYYIHSTNWILVRALIKR